MKLRALGQKLKPSTRSKLKVEKLPLPFYQSPEWKGLIAEVKAERGERCEDADHDPRKPRSGVRITGDHIVEIRDGGARLDKRNILLRCPWCNARKTAKARQARLQRQAISSR